MGDTRQVLQALAQLATQPTPQPSSAIPPPSQTPTPEYNPLTGRRDAPTGYGQYISGQVQPALVQPGDIAGAMAGGLLSSGMRAAVRPVASEAMATGERAAAEEVIPSVAPKPFLPEDPVYPSRNLSSRFPGGTGPYELRQSSPGKWTVFDSAGNERTFSTEAEARNVQTLLHQRDAAAVLPDDPLYPNRSLSSRFPPQGGPYDVYKAHGGWAIQDSAGNYRTFGSEEEARNIQKLLYQRDAALQ